MAAGKAAAAKAARQRKATPPRPTTPKPPPKTVHRRVKPVPVTPPAPQKKSFFSKLATFFMLLTALALSRIKSGKVRIAIVAITLLTFATCAYILIKPEPIILTKKVEQEKSKHDKKLKDLTAITIKTVHEKSMNGKPLLVNSLDMEFVYIPPGEFMMGSPDYEPGHGSDERLHKVVLKRGFYMQTTEVTQGQWEKVTGKNPSRFKNCGDDCPIESVSWNDVQRFIKKLNLRSEDTEYRLPIEAQWEYACRAGTQTPFAFGKCLSVDQANYNGERRPLAGCTRGKYRGKTVPVASFSPNTWGLHDMHGNVWEWVQDWYGKNRWGGPKVSSSGGGEDHKTQVIRGGSWRNSARGCRSADRLGDPPNIRVDYYGFRLVLVPGQ